MFKINGRWNQFIRNYFPILAKVFLCHVKICPSFHFGYKNGIIFGLGWHIVCKKSIIDSDLILTFQIESFQYATKVKALISAGTCASVTTTSTICGNASISSSYYETFVYNNYRVVIISGVPNHAAEYNQTSVNPNTRCKWWLTIYRNYIHI